MSLLDRFRRLRRRPPRPTGLVARPIRSAPPLPPDVLTAEPAPEPPDRPRS